MSFAMLMDPMDPKISLPSVRGIRMSWRWTEGLNGLSENDGKTWGNSKIQWFIIMFPIRIYSVAV
jgi:hypothetical protein